MKIYWIRAMAPERVLALIKHLGIKAEFIELDLMKGDLQKESYEMINPNKKVPALVEGDYSLFESSAIMIFLSLKAGSDMWPKDSLEQIDVIKWMSWNDIHWAPEVAKFYFENIVKTTFKMGAPDKTQYELYRMIF